MNNKKKIAALQAERAAMWRKTNGVLTFVALTFIALLFALLLAVR